MTTTAAISSVRSTKTTSGTPFSWCGLDPAVSVVDAFDCGGNTLLFRGVSGESEARRRAAVECVGEAIARCTDHSRPYLSLAAETEDTNSEKETQKERVREGGRCCFSDEAVEDSCFLNNNNGDGEKNAEELAEEVKRNHLQPSTEQHSAVVGSALWDQLFPVFLVSGDPVAPAAVEYRIDLFLRDCLPMYALGSALSLSL